MSVWARCSCACNLQCHNSRHNIRLVLAWACKVGSICPVITCSVCVPCRIVWLIAVAGDNSIDKADIKRLKESGVFGPLTFWVTEIKNLEELGNPNAGVSASSASAPPSCCEHHTGPGPARLHHCCTLALPVSLALPGMPALSLLLLCDADGCVDTRQPAHRPAQGVQLSV
jgi:hypothetical protein